MAAGLTPKLKGDTVSKSWKNSELQARADATHIERFILENTP